MSELENLRPEARRIAGLFDDSLKTRSVFSDGWQIIRTELLRLAGVEAELAALKARIAGSAHIEVTLGCAIDGEIPPDLALCKVALVKVE